MSLENTALLAFPPLQTNERPATMTLFPHLKGKDKAKKDGVHVGDDTSPAVWNQSAEGLTRSSDSDGANNSAMTATSGDPIANTGDAGFNVDNLINNTVNPDDVEAPQVVPSAAPTPGPSTGRGMRNQTDKSFNKSTGTEKTKSKGSKHANPMDIAPKFFTEADLVTYNHIGIAPPTEDTAPKYRERAVQNEGKIAMYVVSLERDLSAVKKDSGNRFAEFAKLMRDANTASQGSSFSKDPLFIDLHKAVGENRAGIQGILNVIPSAVTFEALQNLPKQIDDLNAEVAGLKDLLAKSSPSGPSGFRGNSIGLAGFAPLSTPATTVPPIPPAGTATNFVPATASFMPVGGAANVGVGFTPASVASFAPSSFAAGTENYQKSVVGDYHQTNESDSFRPMKRRRGEDAPMSNDVLFGPITEFGGATRLVGWDSTPIVGLA
ncbi:hypothetical protein B0H17DRAFT_1197144 [Mycena rosella]|uniref:Uncharacterized protein n=1 Tax=Mycena rosella TaxID=1033263 RepID=A0AAD7GJE1_MYCRO|nr:hypothetical protein B0H17DRAFT_1197144 [Mycena rosella]